MGKRGNGEGSIRRRADGRWEARMALPDGGRKSVYGETRAEVAGKLTAALKTAADGLPLPSEKLTVAAYLADWLAMKRPTLKASTYVRYEQFIRLHLVPALGTTKLAKLAPHDLTRLYAALAAPDHQPRSLTSGTIKLIKVMLHGALDYAVKTRLCARNVAAIAPAPRVTRKERPWLNGNEAQAFLTAAHGDRLEALFVLALTTGMRQGELLALRWADVDLDGSLVRGQPSLYVCRSVRPVHGEFLADEPKTAASKRRVMLARPAIEALKRHKVAQTEERLKAGPAWTDLGLVFASPTGGYTDRTHLRKIVHDRLVRAAGLAPLPFHSLRHTAITLMLQDGLDAGTIAKIVGHADGGALIHKVYGHVTPTMLDRAVAGMNARFGS